MPKERNIDFIICDHHTPGEQLPSSFAGLNPERHDSTYPFNALSGCGVGFKLLQAYADTQIIFPLMRLLAISTWLR